MKKHLLILALFVFNNANADTDIIIDKKKNNEVLYEQSYLSMGSMKIENFSIKSTDNEYVIFKGQNLRHLNSDSKYYDFIAKIKQNKDDIDVESLEMIVNGNSDSTVNISGVFSRDSIKDSDSFFDILKNNNNFDLNIKNKSSSSNFLSVFKVDNIQESSEINESLHIIRNGDIFDVKNISLIIDGSFNISFVGTVKLSSTEIEFINGEVEYTFKENDPLANKIMNMLNLKSIGEIKFKNNVYDLTKYLN